MVYKPRPFRKPNKVLRFMDFYEPNNGYPYEVTRVTYLNDKKKVKTEDLYIRWIR